MTPDLRDLLAAAGAEERAAADPLDVAALLGRAHRRRAVRGTTYSAIGLGAAAAIAVGAVSADGLWRDDEQPVPPATETATPRPTRTPAEPTSTPTPTETPDAFAPAWELCGTEDTSEETGPIHLEHYGYLAAITDEPVEVDAALISTQDVGEVTARIVGAHAVEWRDQLPPIVVGVAGARIDASATGPLTAAGTLALPHVDVPITSCEASPLTGGDGAVTTTLDPAGLYGLMLTVEVTTADGTTTRQTLWAFSLGTEPPPIEQEDPYTPGPKPPTGQTLDLTAGSPLRLGTDRTNNQTNATDAENVGCGSGALTSWASDAGVPPIAITGTASRQGDELVVTMTLTNTSAQDVPIWGVHYPGVQVYRDGQLLGSAWFDEVLRTPNPWPAGRSFQVEWSLGSTTCYRPQAWPSGTYELYLQGFTYQPPEVQPGIPGIRSGPISVTLD